MLAAEGVRTPVSFVGNSMGAAVSAQFAARFPDATERVVLVDMPGLGTVPALWRLAMSRPAEFGLRTALRVVPHQIAARGLDWTYAHVAAADPRTLDPLARAGFSGPYAGPGRVPDLLPIGRALVDELRRADLARIVAAAATPTLLVFGSRDLLTPARVLRRLPQVDSVVLPGCGHCPQLDQPGELLAEVLPFLAAATPEPMAATA